MTSIILKSSKLNFNYTTPFSVYMKSYIVFEIFPGIWNRHSTLLTVLTLPCLIVGGVVISWGGRQFSFKNSREGVKYSLNCSSWPGECKKYHFKASTRLLFSKSLIKFSKMAIFGLFFGKIGKTTPLQLGTGEYSEVMEMWEPYVNKARNSA